MVASLDETFGLREGGGSRRSCISYQQLLAPGRVPSYDSLLFVHIVSAAGSRTPKVASSDRPF